MTQLTKQELLNQLLGLNSAELLEIESAIHTINKLQISNTNTQQKKSKIVKISTKNSAKKDVIINGLEGQRFTEQLFCTKCGCTENIVKAGKRKSGLQRYKCKNCGKYFTSLDTTLLSGTHKNVEVWEKFMECFNNGDTLRETAEKCGIHRNTAFMWRHKVLNALREKEEQMMSLSGIVEADETYVLISSKGNHKNNTNFRYANGRTKARKRGGENTKRGLSKELACVTCGVSRGSKVYSKVTGQGKVSADEIKDIFTGIIKNESILCTDGATAYQQFAQENNLQLEELIGGKEVRGIYHLNTVNSYHSAIKKFIDRYYGVATKYLNNYLVWCNWLKRSRLKDKDRLKGIWEIILSYQGTIRYCDVVQGAY